LTQEQRRWLKRRQAIEPVIGHLKTDHRMSRCWLKGAVGDAINAVLSAAGYNLRWLLRAVAAGTIKPFYFVQILRRLISGIRYDLGTAAQKARRNVQRVSWCLGHQTGFMRLGAAR
jgi:IS5 family transposase